MARCDEGYLCHVCGGEVAAIVDSDLYLAYVLGEAGVEELLGRPERHIRCNPERAQYIADPRFPPVRCEGFFCRDSLDTAHVAAEEERVTRAWRRLQEIPSLGIPIGEYPISR